MDGARPPLVGVRGSGAWGTALAIVAARAGCQVRLVGRDPALPNLAAARGECPSLPGIPLPETVAVSCDPVMLADVDALVLAVPTQSTRAALEDLATVVPAATTIVSAAKGIERGTGALVADIITSLRPQAPVAVLSGPGFADDVGRGLPTAVTIAAAGIATADHVARLFAGPAFRPYTTDDLVGVQLGGALKNVLAIAAGVVAGRRLGASAEAAVITRGFVEMRRLAAASGARADTLMGLSGLGDLILTCRSVQSRNFALGVAIGEGGDPRTFPKLAEGAATAAVAVARARALGVDVPIMAAVADVLDGTVSVEAAVDLLLARPLKREDVI
jgi:glycerol-3-phosphate dehydrogenase (NAD(P)+)